MNRQRTTVLVSAVVGLAWYTSTALAQINDFTWDESNTGAQSWQLDGNWLEAGFPNSPTDEANLSVALGGDLTLDVGGADIVVASLAIGGAPDDAVATDVASSGGRLVFRNDDEADEPFNGGVPLITSGGASGSSNTISAPIHANDQPIDVAGENDLSLSGPFTFEGAGASLRVMPAGQTVTMSGPITVINATEDPAIDLRLNNADLNQGTLVVNGIVSGDGRLGVGVPTNNAEIPLSTVVLNSANTHGGGTRAGRANLVLGHDNALGSGGYSHGGPANQFGYNILSDNDSRTISNDMTIGQWQTFRGDHSLTWAGSITQTNNRGIVNLLPAGKTLTLSGLIEIWDDDEDLQRDLEIDGTGTTLVTGEIRDDPLASGEDRRLTKSGTGVLIVDVEAGNNTHSGPTIVKMGNLHYANNDSLNFGTGLIRSLGGAVGVDAGVSDNFDLMALIEPGSTGGLMLADSDAAADLDFTGTLAQAENMSVAAPETGLTFTGTITPANDAYRLGGGTGTLTLPDAQLSGDRRVEVVNGGAVELLGDNTYTGATTIITKYTGSHQTQAEADTAQNISGLFYEEVAPTLVADKLADGGSPSSIGSASSDAENLFIQGSTLKYVGEGDSTDRLFTIGTGGATIDASGAGALIFSNPGELGRDDAEDRTGTLDDFSGQPNEVLNVGDASDIIVGMTINDPDDDVTLGAADECEGPGSANCIPSGSVVTGISDDGAIIGIDNAFPFIRKVDTRLVFGTVERTLTLTGDNQNANTLTPVVSDSPAGGVVGIHKTGPGTWLLNGENTYTGETVVSEGVLGGTGTIGADLIVEAGAAVAPGASPGTLSVNGDFTLNESATLAVEIAGAGEGQFDLLDVAGDAILQGLVDVTLLDDPALTAGDMFTVLTAANVSGSGLSLVGPSAAMFDLLVNSGAGGSVVLEFTGGGGEPIPGDFDMDGDVDGDDLTDPVLGWEANFGDSLTGDDFLTWQRNFGATSAPAAGAAVPEPAAAVLACAVLVFASLVVAKDGNRRLRRRTS